MFVQCAKALCIALLVFVVLFALSRYVDSYIPLLDVYIDLWSSSRAALRVFRHQLRNESKE